MTQTPQLLIFLSCGTPHDKSQEDFIAAVEAHLESHSCTPQTVGRSVYSARQPVEASRDLIGSCHGAIVIAFERTRIIAGLDRPDSPQQKDIHDESHPTIWNQMEAAMAYAQRVPILTFVQSGLKRQGMLSDRFEWKAIETDLRPALLASKEFKQVFSEWIALVKKGTEQVGQSEVDPAELKLGVLMRNLSVKQAIGVLLVALGAAGSIGTVSFKAGQTWQESTTAGTAATKAATSRPPAAAASTP
jgi:hypothetical protein